MPPKPNQKHSAMDCYRRRIRESGILNMTLCSPDERWDTVGRELLWCENSKGTVDIEKEWEEEKAVWALASSCFHPCLVLQETPLQLSLCKQPTSHTLSIHVSSLERGQRLMTWTNSSRHSPTGRTGGCGQSRIQKTKKEKVFSVKSESQGFF